MEEVIITLYLIAFRPPITSPFILSYTCRSHTTTKRKKFSDYGQQQKVKSAWKALNVVEEALGYSEDVIKNEIFPIANKNPFPLKEKIDQRHYVEKILNYFEGYTSKYNNEMTKSEEARVLPKWEPPKVRVHDSISKLEILFATQFRRKKFTDSLITSFLRTGSMYDDNKCFAL